MQLLVQITCDKCGSWINAGDVAAPNDPNLLLCGCCAAWHDHDRAAEETGVACRPVTVTLLSPAAMAPPEPW